MNEYEFLTNYKEKMINDYINENKEKAFQVSGVYKEFDSLDIKNLIKEEKEIKLFFNDEFLEKFEIDFSRDIKFENNNKLIINNIISSIDIQGCYIDDTYGIKFDIKKEEYNIFSLWIKNIDDFGLILMIPNKIKEFINYDNLCFDLFKLWDSIFKKIGLNEKSTIDYFNLFISSIIKRRNENVSNWIKEMTENYNNLKELRNQYSPLDNIWILCQEKCKYCYYKCCLLQGHQKEHECPYNHKCKEKCSYCYESKCNDENCEHNCENKSGHPGIHKCSHLHQCKGNCSLKEFSIDCKEKCILEYNHSQNHDCGIKIHHCKENCYLIGKARKCNKKCNLPFPHEGKEHDCGAIHYCLNDCDLKNKSKKCKEICILEYNHGQKHDCGEIHYCIENCYLNGKAKDCGKNCILPYQHEGEHNCRQKHYCLFPCDLKDKSIGCEGTCILEYDHKGNHDCGKAHYCMEDCHLKDKSNKCGEKCKLKLPHKGKNHNCGEIHYCNNKCSFFFEKTKNCEKICSYLYGHKNECKCRFPKEKHLCNKKCTIKNDCDKDCILIAGHKGKCLCGFCNCPEPCKYKDKSRNCKEKCQFKAGHSEKEEHICDNNHYCKLDCNFKEISLNCNQFCYLEANHSGEKHVCNLSRHICNGKCYLYDNSRNCKKACSLEAGHEGSHICINTLEEHLCNGKCNLFEQSRACNEFCTKPVNHLGNHVCSLEISEHICKKECSLYYESRKGCKKNCCLKAGHKEDCICQNSKEEHKCKLKCKFYNKAYGCGNDCELSSGHKGDHKCKITNDQHICRGSCSLNGKSRVNCLNNSKCCLPFGHNGDCLCNKNHLHLCNDNCILYFKVKEGCNQLCSLEYGHSGEHLCNIPKESHLCPEKCYYYGKSKGKCNQLCNLSYGHKGKCICKKPHDHFCNGECSFYGKSGGCNRECSLKYEHEKECLCNTNFHTCKEKCELCTMECGHIYNHNSCDNLRCIKCNNIICKLSKKGHLCGGQHDCPKECEADGCCEIESFVQQEVETYKSEFGEEIQYHTIKLQEIKKKQCICKIPMNEFSHKKNIHICGGEIHKCGFKCPQCEYCCTESYGHSGLHRCLHGNIKNSYFSILDNYAMIRKENRNYKMKQGETAKIFFCDEYCREQGQGHTHLFDSLYRINIDKDIDIRFFKEENGKYTYECKCSYYWEHVLKFNGNFTSDEKKKFSLCSWRCKYESHQIPEYCQLTLWHKKENKIPKGIYGTWIFQGHVFKCIHPIGIYPIFLIDQSGSMESKSVRPTNTYIKKNMDNILGASIQEIFNFCKIRDNLSPKDKCALIAFNDKASKIFENMSIGDDNILIEFLSKLKPKNATLFVNAFKEAKLILESINRTEYIPIIILLTDGLDHEHQETINYIKNNVST